MNLFDLTRKAGKLFLKNSAHREIFHVHTYRCRHAANVADEMYILKAIELGAVSITFTDHAPFPGNPFGNRMDIQQLSEYLDSLSRLKEKYLDRYPFFTVLSNGFSMERLCSISCSEIRRLIVFSGILISMGSPFCTSAMLPPTAASGET